MIHIKKTKHGFTVETRASSRGRRNLSSTGSQLFATKQKAFEGIQAQMPEWRSELYVLVQDDTVAKPVVYRVFLKGKDKDVTIKPE